MLTTAIPTNQKEFANWLYSSPCPDPHSYANCGDVAVTHYDISLRTDFTKQILHGSVYVTAKVINPTDCLFLDVKSLNIESVTDDRFGNDYKPLMLHWSITKTHAFGNCLAITIPEDKRYVGCEFFVLVKYATTPESESIQWLTPEQTAGKQYPYCYTQCEAILARTLLPCQDTPSNKTPFRITVSCPAPLVAVCSGNPVGQSCDQRVVEADGYTSYSFVQPNSVPTYLIALVVGKLESGPIGPRSTVYTEKELLDRAIYEFSEDTENYIRAGEEITNIKYKWGTYDMVVLPSAFPYGGMENPNLTFLSSSLLAGDRSLTNVVAHEIVHSWSGNLITNASWNDFWLNEGFTVYIERMVLGRVTNSVQFRHFEMLCGYNDLKKTINELKDKPGICKCNCSCFSVALANPTCSCFAGEFTKLVPNLNNVDPDDAFSKIPYEKGSLFLYFLETVVGGEEEMCKWLHSYFTEFTNKSLNTLEMKAHFLNHFSNTDLSSVDWETWLYAPGLPPLDPTLILDKTLSQNCTALAQDWLLRDGQTAHSDDLKNFRSEQIMFFLDEIINGTQGLSHETLDRMEFAYHFSSSPNVEICFRWLQLCLKSNYTNAIPQVAVFLSKHGRGLYVKPLYKLLNAVDHDAAVTIYKANRPYYHSVIRNAFDKLLEYSS